jgi:hypothetical protein
MVRKRTENKRGEALTRMRERVPDRNKKIERRKTKKRRSAD